VTSPSEIPVPGSLLASGREADVYALDDGRVLRRYRVASGHDSADEAGVMAYAASKGFPAPVVYAAGGTDMVMGRLEGPTMAQAALAGDIALTECGSLLARLIQRLHEIPTGTKLSIVHMDLHPENVIMTERGPVVIDWRNAGHGDADLDTAMTALILAQIAIKSIEHPLGDQARVVLDQFLTFAPGNPLRRLDEAVELKSAQRTMSPEEVEALPVAAVLVRGDG
jgi:aminoglycoside phosphotransferase (APT) family kinase protein